MAMQAKGVKSWSKPDGSTVTEGDLAVNDLLVKRLRDVRPTYGWLSEETEDDLARLLARFTWVVDPIDGTNSYVQRSDTWCVGVALLDDGAPVLSAVFHPQLDRFYQAQRGEGCLLNGQRLHIADNASLKGARIMGSKPLTTKLEGAGTETIPARQTALLARFAMVTSGELDGVVSTGPKYDWDLAAGDLLVTEAGGVVTGIHREALVYNRASRQQSGLVAASASRHKAIAEQLELT